MFAVGDGADAITDFGGDDLIRLDGVSGGFEALVIEQDGGDAVIRYGDGGDTIRLSGVSVDNLDADDFILPAGGSDDPEKAAYGTGTADPLGNAPPGTGETTETPARNGLTLEGGDGDDTLRGGDGADTLRGGKGNDTLWGDDGADTLWGGAGDDWFSGDDGDDVLHGGEGNDRIYGGDGDDVFYGGAGNDVFWGDVGDDELNGGDGDDTILACLGDDTLNGGAGNDTLGCDAGNDTLNGGAGRDLADYTHSTAAVTINLQTGEARGGDAEGDTLISIEDLYGSKFNDVLIGDSGRNVLFANTGNDTLHGGAGNDDLRGGSGDDEIHGGDGDDKLYGGAGNDSLIGGSGDDTFVFSNDYMAEGDTDTIVDFGSGNDRIKLIGFTKDTNTGIGVRDLGGKITRDGGNTTIDLTDFGGGMIVLEDFTGTLDSSDFIL